MLSFGQILRQQRESRSFSLSEIADATRINIRYLQALEEEQHEILPHPTFVKGFLRLYAKHLGLDGDDLVLNYERSLLSKQERLAPQPSCSEVPVSENKPYFLTVFAFFLLVLLIVGLFFFVRFASLCVFPKKSTDQKNPDSVKQLDTNTPATKKLPSISPKTQQFTKAQPALKKPLTSPPVKIQNNSIVNKNIKNSSVSSLSAKVPGAVSINLLAEEDCWFSVCIDDQPALNFFLRPGQNKTLSAKKTILFKTIGNTHGLTLSFKGKSLPLREKRANVIHDLLFSPETNLSDIDKKL